MICGKCGEMLPDGAKFCGSCGWKVEGVEITPVAETQNAEAAEPAQELFEAETAVAAEAPAATEEPKKAPKEKAPKEGKKKTGLIIGIIAAAVVVLVGAIIGIAVFLNSLKRQEIDMNEAVTFQVTGYSGYGEAVLVINEDEMEDKYEDIIAEHTKIRWSKFVDSVDLYEYEVTDMSGLSNGDKITLTWEFDSKKASEEYKVDLLGESVVYTVTGLPELEKIDPFEDLSVTFSGNSGDGYADISIVNYDDYFSYFWYTTSQTYDLSNGDTVTISFDVTDSKDWVAERYGYILSPTEKTYTVSGLTEYVLKNEQVTSEAVKPMLGTAEELIYEHVNDYWSTESSVKAMECIGHFVSKPESNSYGANNVVGLIYKINANVFTEGRSLDVEYYYPVMFRNVVLKEDGSFAFDPDDAFRTGDRFSKQFEALDENDTNVPWGSWSFYGYETLDELKEAYDEYDTSWTDMVTESYVEKNYTAEVSNQIKADYAAEIEKIKAGDPQDLIGYAIDTLLGRVSLGDDAATLNSVKAVNTMLYGSDIVSASVPKTCLDIVLEVNSRVQYKEMQEDFPFYYVVRFPNVAVGTDGRLTANHENRVAVDGEFDKMLGDEEIYEGWFAWYPSNVWTYEGFQTLDEALALGNEIRMDHVVYHLLNSAPYVSADAEKDITAWGNADDSAVVAAAEVDFRGNTTYWAESVTVKELSCVDTYLISNGVPTKSDEYAVLLKVVTEMAYADNVDTFEYYTVVRYTDAKLTDAGVVTVGECLESVPNVLVSKQMGDEVVLGPDGALNVWDFYGYATLEEAESAVQALANRYDQINYSVEKVPEPVVEEPAVTPDAEGETPVEGETPAEGEAPAEEPAA